MLIKVSCIEICSKINIDQIELRKIYLQKVEECLKNYENETLF